jgi:hypothetical protein
VILSILESASRDGLRFSNTRDAFCWFKGRMDADSMFAWPGKSAADGQERHPAVLHMLDVGAVAERLIAPFDIEPALRDALVLLVAPLPRSCSPHPRG